MKKWIKYIAVIGCFLLMAGIFVPDSGSKVRAEEANQGEIPDGSDDLPEGQNEGEPEGQNEGEPEGQNEGEPEGQNEGEPEGQNGEPTDDPNGNTKTGDAESKTLTVTWMSDGAEFTGPSSITGTKVEGESYTYTIVFPKPTKDGATFAGWKCSDTSITDNTYQAETSAELVLASAITEITFTAQWTDEDSGTGGTGNESDETITLNPTNNEISGESGKSGTFFLHGEYHLGEGSWTVEGDSSIYPGGITFYVSSGGSYTFKKQ